MMKFHTTATRAMRIASIVFIVMITFTIALADLGGTEGGFDLTWHTIDGGGGTSTGGSFELAGTIGQPDAGDMTGGEFVLRGGFWPGAGDPIPAPTCPPDIAPPGGDNAVGVPDLLLVINSWGACPTPPDPCVADIAPPGGDGSVGVPDLLMIINNWGMCP